DDTLRIRHHLSGTEPAQPHISTHFISIAEVCFECAGSKQNHRSCEDRGEQLTYLSKKERRENDRDHEGHHPTPRNYEHHRQSHDPTPNLQRFHPAKPCKNEHNCTGKMHRNFSRSHEQHRHMEMRPIRNVLNARLELANTKQKRNGWNVNGHKSSEQTY